MSLDQIITVQIDRNTTTPSQVGFGTPCLVGFFPTSLFSERVQTFSSLQEMIDAGFTVSDPLYGMASNLLAQNPSPPTFKIGRRVGAPQQVLEITPTELEVGSVHEVTITGYADSSFATRASVTDTASYTVITSDTATDICDGLRTDLTPTGDYSEGGTATLTITADNTTMDGLLFGVTYTVNGLPVGIDDNTPNPTVKIATDLTAINTVDSDWYALAIDSSSSDEILGGGVAAEGAADWVESNTKIFACQTQDPAVASVTDASDDPSTGSLAAQLKGANYDRTMLFFQRDNMDRVDCAMLGRGLPEDAGSITWAYKELASTTAQTLTTSEMTNLEAKNVNFNTTLAGVNITRYGTASGGEYIDVMRGADWLAARIQERVYGVLLNNDKLPYTDAGIQAVRGEILAQLDAGIARDFIAADPAPTCTVPLAANVSAADKGNRFLDDVTFRATLAGAIHKVAIEGELNL